MSSKCDFAKQSNLKVGVLSDTHLPYRMKQLPPQIYEIFADVDLILHAGDVDKVNLLRYLEEIAPLYAVRGNIHLFDFSLGGIKLPREIRKNLSGHRVVVTHGHRPGLIGCLLKIPEVCLWDTSDEGARLRNLNIAQRLHKCYPEADCVIFGHTHTPFCGYLEKTLFFNPGSTMPDLIETRWPCVGLLEISPNKIEPNLIKLKM